MGQILLKTSFVPQNEPHRAKLIFSGVLKNFFRNGKKLIFKDKKLLSQKEGKNCSERIFFSTGLKRRKS